MDGDESRCFCDGTGEEKRDGGKKDVRIKEEETKNVPT